MHRPPIAPVRRLLLLGGGHAHLAVLAALGARPPAVEVTLVTPERYQYYSGMLPGWIAGHYSSDECRIDLQPLAERAGAELVLARANGLDVGAACAELSNGRRLSYELLSIDIGSEIDTSWLALAGDKLLPARPVSAFFQAWPQVLLAARGRADFRLLVAGGGAAGVELAFAVRQALPHARIDLVAGQSGLLGSHGAGVQGRARAALARAGIVVQRGPGVGVEPGLMLAGGKVLAADCILGASGARAPAWLRDSGLALDEAGFVAVDPCHRSISHGTVFAAGDVCARQDRTVPRSGVHAVRAGPVLAANLLAALDGRPLQPYRPRRRALSLLATGPRHAIASWGRFGIEGGWVWRWKDRIDRAFIARYSAATAHIGKEGT